jgi:peroxiredoxin
MLALAIVLAAATASPAPAAGDELVGKPAPAWEVAEWINSRPLTLEGLRGKVVLVRWFTSTDCPYCSATAPALNQLDRDFARGLVVVGMYHHKSDDPLDMKKIQGWVGEYGFKFPVAVDRDWKTLRRWWLTGPHRDFTSVSFLIDKKGIVRRIHPGGSMALGGEGYAGMRSAIERLLAE